MKQEIRAQLDDLADTLGCLEAQLRGSSKRAPDGATRLSVEQAERIIELYRRDIVKSCRNADSATALRAVNRATNVNKGISDEGAWIAEEPEVVELGNIVSQKARTTAKLLEASLE